MATKAPKSKKAAPKKPDADLFNQPKAPEVKKTSSIAKPKFTIKGEQVSRNLPALRSNTLPAVKDKPSATKPAKNMATKLGSALKGKGKIGLIGGLLAAGAAAGYSALNRGAGTSKKKVAAETAKKKTVAETSSSKDAAPVSILKGVDRRDEIGKPSSPMVLKSSTTPTPKPKSTPSKIRKPDSFSRKNIAKGLSAKTVGVKSSSPIGKTPEGAVKNVSLSRPSSTASKSSVAQKPTLKDLRKEKRSERKLTRMDRREDRKDRRENRIINKTAKLKAKR
jgi:hypothetical protein